MKRFRFFPAFHDASSVANKQMYLFLLALTLASAVGLQGWRTLINNFAVEVAGLDGFQNGVVQSVRELPGFLALLVVYLLFVVTEKRLAALSVAVLGLGVALTGLFPSFWGLIFTTLIMSFGFHYFETLNMSLTLQHFNKLEAPLVSGRLRGASSAANLAVGGLIFVMAFFLSYGAMFIVLGLAVAAAGLYSLRMDPGGGEDPPGPRKMVFRKKYWLFYTLTFLAGARRQVFVAFAVFLLVQQFHYSVQAVTALFVINNVVNLYASPLIGICINRYGERAVLSLEYGSLILIFFVYAYTDSWFIVGIMYVLDHVFFNFAIAVRTYFQKIADPEDIAPSMAVGFTINHIAAVVIPVLGGLAWLENYKTVFIAGAVLSGLSLAFTQCIRSNEE